MNYAAVTISILALAFTVFSFYWMNWRRGKLLISPPRTYAAIGSQSGKLVIDLPLVFFNNGPIPIVVQNLRLLFPEDKLYVQPLRFIATVEKIGTKEGRGFATQFPVRGREAVKMICEFQREPGNLIFKTRVYAVELQAKLDYDERWQTLLTFKLRVNLESMAAINSQFVAHDNEDV